ncbi:unnamed protein product [Prorocentrum cordatum]|uniref:Fe2OG dioxygenase domain-containing protein n=1 Tax=Prorocentrum cordatum TaxID=2364126 RepID=A0ABN9QTK6_9DINO|nr:unnamed protein product [Polarella glacialis]
MASAATAFGRPLPPAAPVVHVLSDSDDGAPELPASSAAAAPCRAAQLLVGMGFAAGAAAQAAGAARARLGGGADSALVVAAALDALQAQRRSPQRPGAASPRGKRAASPGPRGPPPGRSPRGPGGLCRAAAQQVLPPGLVERVRPAFESRGSRDQPWVHVRNVDGREGRLVASLVFQALQGALGEGFCARLKRRRRTRDGIISDHRHPEWHTSPRLSVLQDLASQLLAYLSAPPAEGSAPAVPRGVLSRLREPRRQWNDTEVLIYNPGCRVKRHHDAQPPGSLLLVFSAGLSGSGHAWPHGQLVESVMQSGDVVIMDGKRTEHAIPDVLEGTSPFRPDEWLGNRRLAVLVREAPP